MANTYVQAAIPPEAASIARRVDDLAAESRSRAAEAVKAAIQCGVELYRLRSILNDIFVPLLRNGGLVSIGCTTAYKYMQLAERMLAPDELAAALEAPAGSQALIGQTVRALDAEAGKSLTQLYRDYGILGRGKAGGARPGAGRRKQHMTEAEEYELVHREGFAPFTDLETFAYGGAMKKMSVEDLLAWAGRLLELAAVARAEAERKAGHSI